MDRKIKIVGTGKRKVTPDLVCIYLDVSGVKKSYEEALALSSNYSKKLASSIEDCGFTREDFKTTDFDVTVKYENKERRDHTYKKEFIGYEFQQEFKLEFLKDNEKLNKVLNALMSSEVKPDLRLEFALADESKHRNELLVSAIQDSKERAEVIAKAAGVTLGDIIDINYSWENKRNFVEPIDLYKGVAPSAVNFDFVPEDIELQDDIEVVWEIK